MDFQRTLILLYNITLRTVSVTCMSVCLSRQTRRVGWSRKNPRMEKPARCWHRYCVNGLASFSYINAARSQQTFRPFCPTAHTLVFTCCSAAPSACRFLCSQTTEIYATPVGPVGTDNQEGFWLFNHLGLSAPLASTISTSHRTPDRLHRKRISTVSLAGDIRARPHENTKAISYASSWSMGLAVG